MTNLTSSLSIAFKLITLQELPVVFWGDTTHSSGERGGGGNKIREFSKSAFNQCVEGDILCCSVCG